jgi:hypothetical protein
MRRQLALIPLIFFSAVVLAMQPLVAPELSEQTLAELVATAAALQAQVLPDAAPLAGEAWARDWLGWLVAGLHLEDREAREPLTAYGGLDDQTLERWLEQMAQLVLLYDAYRLALAPEAAEQLLAALDAADEAEAARLSYQLLLIAVSADARQRVAPVAPQLAQLVAQAQGGR